MDLFYDQRDDAAHQARGSQILDWLDDLGARPLAEAGPDATGFLFAGARSIEDYEQLIAGQPQLRDRADERGPLLDLDSVLQTMAAAGVHVPAPRTWRLPLDAPVPDDLTFPLFVRTATTSLKLGGRISRVETLEELEIESAELRRVLGWDALVLAREWMDLAPAGEGTYGPIPQEVRVWVVDGIPVAWSFHHLHLVPRPTGFPPTHGDIVDLTRMAGHVASAFRSRLVVTDFARRVKGGWVFIEAGPGSCAGTAHQGVFKHVAHRLQAVPTSLEADVVGGPICGRHIQVG